MNKPIAAPATHTTGILDTIKQKFSDITDSLTWDRKVSYALCFLWALLAGFLVKRFGNSLFYAFIGAIIVTSILYYFQLITIDWTALQTAGIIPAPTIEGTISEYIRLSRVYIVELIVSTVAFVVGYKIS
ncbi:MAG: hypothetical protein WCE21_03445 [Candidatus Babeliales bacterium]